MSEQIETPVVEAVVPVTKTPTTYKEVWALPREEYKRMMANPKEREVIDQIIAEHNNQVSEPEVVENDEAAATPEEKEVAETVAETVSEVVKEKTEPVIDSAVATAEEKALEEKARIAAEEEAKPKQKLIEDFQAADEAGNPIGRRTHLEADTEEEMREKLKIAYENAARYAERIKKKRAEATSRPDEPIISTLSKEELAQVQADAQGTDETKATAAKLKLELDQIRHERITARYNAGEAKNAQVAYQFMQKHLMDYNPCQANADIISAYLKDNDLEWTVNNLELAFEIKKFELAQPVKIGPDLSVIKAEVEAREEAAEKVRVAAEAKVRKELEAEIRKKIEQEQQAANTAAAQASVAAAALAATPTPAETVTTAVNPPVVARKLPASGIEPGTLHGTRSTQPLGLTKQDIAKMSGAEFRKKLRDPQFKKQLIALGIKV
jgi:hypothetical protein